MARADHAGLCKLYDGEPLKVPGRHHSFPGCSVGIDQSCFSQVEVGDHSQS